MDWDRVKTPVKPPPDPTAPTLVEMCWRVVGPSRKVVDCGIYTTDAPGFEVRSGYGVDDPLFTRRVATIEDARDEAVRLRAVVDDKGSFEELPIE